MRLLPWRPFVGCDRYNDELGTIGRANTDGTHVRQSFITGAIGPAGLALSGR